jgi:ABC-2 type transport system permease protein
VSRLETLVRAQGRRIFNGLFREGFFSGFKWFGGLLLGVLFLTGLYFLFLKALTFFNSMQLVGEALAEKLLSLIFLTLLGMVFFSNVVYTLSTTYLSEDLQLLNSLPVSRGEILLLKFSETFWDSSWMPALLFLPLFAAYGRAYQADFFFYEVAFIILVLFLLIPAAMGFLFTAALMWFFPARRVRDLFLLTGMLAVGTVLLILRLSGLDPLLQHPDQLNGWVDYMSALRAPAAPYLPSAWASEAVLGVLFGKFEPFYSGISKILFLGMPFCLFAFAVSRQIFFKGWCHAQESQGAAPSKNYGGGGRLEKVLFFLSPPLRALLIKDFKLFIRDSSQWAQLILLLSLIAVYLVNYRKLPLDIYKDLKNLLFFLSTGFSGFILAAVATRYIFPTVSLEGRAFWVIRSSPLSLSEFLWGKFWIAFVPLFLLSEIIMVFSVFVLQVDQVMAGTAFGTMFLLSLGLSTLGIGLGSIFTYFKVDNAPKISTSLGGYVYIMASVSLIAATLALEATPLKVYYSFHALALHTMPWEFYVPGFYGAMLYLGVVYWPLRQGVRALARKET